MAYLNVSAYPRTKAIQRNKASWMGQTKASISIHESWAKRSPLYQL